MLKVEENKLKALQTALTKGEESGTVENFNIDEFQREMDKELGAE